jgi:hypothetical protein
MELEGGGLNKMKMHQFFSPGQQNIKYGEPDNNEKMYQTND